MGPPTTLKSSTKFTATVATKVKTIAKNSAILTLGTANPGPPASFPTSGPILKGAFLGQVATAIATLDLDTAGLTAACLAPGGLAALSFTGVLGPSTLDIP